MTNLEVNEHPLSVNFIYKEGILVPYSQEHKYEITKQITIVGQSPHAPMLMDLFLPKRQTKADIITTFDPDPSGSEESDPESHQNRLNFETDLLNILISSNRTKDQLYPILNIEINPEIQIGTYQTAESGEEDGIFLRAEFTHAQESQQQSQQPSHITILFRPDAPQGEERTKILIENEPDTTQAIEE